MERRPAVGSKCGVGILHVHVCQVKTITKNVPTIILTVNLRTWLIISRKLSLCGLFWTTLYNDMEFAFQILHIGPKIKLVFAIAAGIKVSNLKVRLEEATVNQIIKFILRKIFGRGSSNGIKHVYVRVKVLVKCKCNIIKNITHITSIDSF